MADFKVVVVGESGVGKTSLLFRLVKNEFSPSFVSTIGIDMHIFNTTVNGAPCKMQIWDTAGQERFKTITNAFYRGAHAVIIVIDLTQPETLKRISEWVDTCTRLCNSQIRIILVANKSDMVADRAVSNAEIAKYVELYGLYGWYITSAASGDHVRECFDDLVDILRRPSADGAVVHGNGNDDVDVITLESNTSQSSSSSSSSSSSKSQSCCK